MKINYQCGVSFDEVLVCFSQEVVVGTNKLNWIEGVESINGNSVRPFVHLSKCEGGAGNCISIQKCGQDFSRANRFASPS